MGNDRCMIMGYNKNIKRIFFIYTNLFKKCKLSNEKKMNVKENESNERPIKLKIL